MSTINNNGFNPDINFNKISPKEVSNNDKKAPVEKQQTDASSPVAEAGGRSVVKVDNHDADMRRLLANPSIADTSDKFYNAAIKAGISAPEAATFATSEMS